MVVGASLPACGDGGGDMNPPQESVSDGTINFAAAIDVAVAAGAGVFGLSGSEVADGWTVEYSRFLVTIGAFEFTQADGMTVTHEELGIVDVLASGSPQQIATVMVAAGASKVKFSMPAATNRFQTIAPATAADRELMIKGGYSVYIEGAITRDDGYSCVPGKPNVCTPARRVEFKWGVPIAVKFADCAKVAVAGEETLDRTLTLAGDMWFHTGFTDAAAEVRRAQWIANADLDRNGETTLDELGRVEAKLLFNPKVYDLRTEAPLVVTTALDFFTAQTWRIGRGFGECASTEPL